MVFTFRNEARTQFFASRDLTIALVPFVVLKIRDLFFTNSFTNLFKVSEMSKDKVKQCAYKGLPKWFRYVNKALPTRSLVELMLHDPNMPRRRYNFIYGSSNKDKVKKVKEEPFGVDPSCSSNNIITFDNDTKPKDDRSGNIINETVNYITNIFNGD